MNRETYEKQRAFAGELKPSMKRRAVDHDYHERRIYLVTLVVEGRRPLLGRLAGMVSAEPGTLDYPHIEPTPLGAAVAKMWLTIPEHHPGVEVLAFQLMPDHVHGILFVTRYLEEGLGKVILGFKQACNKEFRRLVGVEPVAVAQQQAQQQAQQPAQQPLDRYHGLLFERGYNDSILLRRGQLETMKRYLADNPFRLAMKRARPEYLRVRQGVDVCGSACSAVGNLSLLTAARKLRVRISRSIDATLLEREKERLLAAAREGAVLVSPAISPGEKAITRAAFDEGLPMIVLLDNGLDPNRNNRVTISRATCEALNALAWDICEGQ